MKRNKFSRVFRDKTNAMEVLVTNSVKPSLLTHPEVGTAICERIYFIKPLTLTHKPMSENVGYVNFVKQIASDFNLTLDKEYTLKLPADKKTIKNFTRSVASKVRIFDGAAEHPYMVDGKRNNEALANGVELRYFSLKYLAEIIKESGVKLKTENCKISEGGGWHSNGTRYTYNNIYCEF